MLEYFSLQPAPKYTDVFCFYNMEVSVEIHFVNEHFLTFTQESQEMLVV